VEFVRFSIEWTVDDAQNARILVLGEGCPRVPGRVVTAAVRDGKRRRGAEHIGHRETDETRPGRTLDPTTQYHLSVGLSVCLSHARVL